MSLYASGSVSVAADLGESLNNQISNLNIQSGESVLILSDYDKDREVIDALSVMAKERGADVTIMYMKPACVGGRDEPPKNVQQACFSSDIVISCTTYPLLFTRTVAISVYEHNVRWTEIPGDMASISCLTSEGAKFPMGLLYVIGEKVADKWFYGKEIKITDARGSDFTARIPPGGQNLSFGKGTPGRTQAMTPGVGAYVLWPMGEINYCPPDSADGVIYCDGFYGVGYSETPIKLTFKDGFCVSIEGGHTANMLKDLIRGIDFPIFCGEVAMGFNPKMRINLRDSSLIDAERNAGVAHFAIGGTRTLGAAINRPECVSRIHLDGTILEPTLTIDGEPLIENGRPTFLDDPDIREAAKRFGDPDKLLQFTKYVVR